MSDNFATDYVGLESPGVNVHRPDFSTSDADLPFTTRFIVCDAAGSLDVDTPNNTNVTIHVEPGRLPIRITKIYDTSDAITVDCWE